MLAIALSLLFAGCDILTKLGIGSGDDSDEGGEPAWTGPQIVAEDETGIKAKFGIEAEGTEGVTAAFETLHAFIQSGGLAKYPDAIRLGDWIDLEGGLAVEAYGTGNDMGGFNHDAVKATEPVYNEGEAWGTLLRLIVVGVNSFNNINGNDTPHVVFQFQNLPVTRRMNPANDITGGGYEKSEMRKYLVPVTDDDESGKFLTGLYNAGVPEGVLWAPARVLSKGINRKGSVTLSDKLWLPTEREMFQDGKSFGQYGSYGPYSADGETAANQARLAYYTGDNTRLKAWCGDDADYYPDMKSGLGWGYWTGSSHFSNAGWYSLFCSVNGGGATSSYMAGIARGVAPAFCVN